MSIPVEASSLSEITTYAANPPKFPRNPAERKRDPLVLYISRVPGKKDLILSTLKPRLKNLTAEDINSSLYYFHLDVPEDSEFIQKYHVERKYEGRRSTEIIRRKPVASKTQVDSLRPPDVPSTEAENSQSYSPNVPRRHLTPSQEVDCSPGASTISSTASEGFVQRHPLGPRPPQSQASLKRKPLPSHPGVENSSFQSPKLPPRPLQSSLGNHNVPPNTFSMTIIRRDPSTMAQWNVGKISSNPLFSDTTPVSECDPENRYGPLYVYIDTLGYLKFRDFTDENDAATTRNVRTSVVFSRKVSMAWESRGGGSFDQQRASETFTTYIPPPGSPKLGRAKGYVFLSPWNGQCSFFTSLGGKALKCKHTLSGNGMKIDPSDPTPHLSAEVSELRFNLPKSPVSSHNKIGRQSIDMSRFTSKFSHMRNKLSSDSTLSEKWSTSVPVTPTIPVMDRPHFTATSDDDDDNEDGDELDNLGREKAGGGNRGKRVKLGKLIVYHEGTQMLDLIVAANMGIFWKSLDRIAS